MVAYGSQPTASEPNKMTTWNWQYLSTLPVGDYLFRGNRELRYRCRNLGNTRLLQIPQYVGITVKEMLSTCETKQEAAEKLGISVNFLNVLIAILAEVDA
jgi:hypothetical protein